MLDYFRITGSQLTFRKRRKKTTVQQREHRLLKHPDVILKVVKVYTKFASDAGVNERQERSGYQNEIYTPFVSGGAESAHIAKYASAENYRHCMAIQLQGGHAIPDRDARVDGLLFLTRRNYDQIVRG